MTNRLRRGFAFALPMVLGVSALRADTIYPLIAYRDTAAEVRDETRAAREALAQARLSFYRARLLSLRLDLVVASQGRPAYGDLQRDALVARTRFNDLRRPVLARLKADEAYSKLNAQRESARDVLRRLTAKEKADYAQLLPYAKAALEAGRRMTRAETIALALDPGIESARLEMVDAYTRLRLAQNAARIEPLGPVEMDIGTARQQIDLANERLAAALRREAAFERE